jgi:hypothetical protein
MKYTIGQLANLPDVQYTGKEQHLHGLPYVTFKFPGIAGYVYVPLGAVKLALPREPKGRAVALDRTGRAWQRTAGGTAWQAADAGSLTWEGVNSHHGPMTVLYEP